MKENAGVHKATSLLTEWIYSFHMPAYFCLSGAVFSMELKKNRYSSVSKLIREKAKRLLIPLLFVWLVWNIPIKMLAGYYDGLAHPLMMAVIQIIFPNAVYLWFLEALFFCFVIHEAEERRLRLYEDYKAEILDEDEYSQLKEHYIAEKQRLEHELQKQRQRALELEKRIKICDAQMERMRGILNQSEFDEELVHELIKKIYVGMDNSVEVEFKCSDPYQEVLAIMSEVQNE